MIVECTCSVDKSNRLPFELSPSYGSQMKRPNNSLKLPGPRTCFLKCLRIVTYASNRLFS
ncbi:hypothetical protein C2G38_2056888 [Gigaspora rosea]|uniref:Uncharacterized protein n=1 Tax=Gigaspora rosea TaxID=44941 RepID=A0A397W5K6_9GLOM|nr:hypothetical protein C2G38_2056888 [Gigaspora rosea]